MRFAVLLLSFNLTYAFSLDIAHLEMVGDFFQLKNKNALNIFTCSKEDTLITLNYFAMKYKKHIFPINGHYRNKDFLAVFKGRHYPVGVFLDLSCEENNNIFTMVSNLGFFNTSYSFLVLAERPSKRIENAFLRSTADLTVVDAENKFFHVQRPRMDVDIIYIELGQWNKDTKLVLTRVPIIRPLEGSIMFASIFLTREIYDKKNKTKLSEQLIDYAFHNGEDLPNRFSYALHLCIAQLFNFSITLTLTNHWGAVRPDGTHTGMMGQIQAGIANVTLGGAKILDPRYDVSDPLMTTHDYWFPFVFIQPRVLGSYRALSLQLTPWVWTCLGLLIIAAALTFGITQKFGDSKFTETRETISASFLQFVGVFAQQGLTIEPYHFSSRLVCLFMLAVGTMVAVFYNAATMNALLSTAPPSIRNIEDLVNSNIELTLVDALYFNNRPVRNRLIPKIAYDKVDKYTTRTYSLMEGLELIKKGKAFSAEYFWIYDAVDKYLDEELKCQLSIVLPFPPFPVTSFVTKYTHLRELFNQGIIRMKENGLSQREIVRWFPKKPKCVTQQAFVFVRLEAISIALFIYLTGFVLSLTFFFCELRERKRKQKTLQVKLFKRNGAESKNKKKKQKVNPIPIV